MMPHVGRLGNRPFYGQNGGGKITMGSIVVVAPFDGEFIMSDNEKLVGC